MKRKRYCVMCAGAVELNFQLKETQTECPHCGAILRTQRSLLGKERISAYRPATESDNTVVTVKYKTPKKEMQQCHHTM